MMSDWDEFEGLEKKPRLQRIAEEYEQAKQQYGSLKATIDDLEMRIVGEVPEDFGEHTIEAGELDIIVKRNDRFQWDQEILNEVLGDMVSLPSFVKVAYSIDKKKFNAASDEERELLLSALTRKQGTINITVKRKD
jgi:hypothetical protein